MKPWFFTALILVLCLGCRHRDGRLEYRGKSLQHWQAQATNKDPLVRREAIEPLSKIGAEGIPSLVRLSQDEDRHVAAVANLAILGQGEAAVPPLKKLLNSPDRTVQIGAAKVLPQILVNMRRNGIPHLIEMLDSPHANVRLQAAKAIVRANTEASKSAIPKLKELTHDESSEVRNVATQAVRLLEVKTDVIKTPKAPKGASKQP
jgi:HEAT repeat protein